MAEATSVQLPWDQAPRWPDRCVACGRESPASSARLTYEWGGDGLLWPWFARGRSVIAEPPCCRACKDALESASNRRARWEHWLLLVAVVTAIAAVWVLLGDPKLWLALPGAVLLCVPYFYWRVQRPLPFEVTADEDGISFKFGDQALAASFRAMNSPLPAVASPASQR